MRFIQRALSAKLLVEAAESFEILEAYPDDKYLPSYLLRGQIGDSVFHALIAADVEGDNVRVVTMYYPSLEKWEEGFRQRKTR